MKMATSIKYLIYSDLVRSKSDGQTHNISYMQLVNLYQLPIKYCTDASREETLRGLDLKNYLQLGVRYLGDYMEYRKFAEAEFMKPSCPYCGNKAELVTGREIYPHREDLFSLQFWRCKPCEAYVGCHKNTDAKPLGRLATAELRKLKIAAHVGFDLIWRGTDTSRKLVYQWLARELGIEVKNCHIGMFDEDTCRRVIEICSRR